MKMSNEVIKGLYRALTEKARFNREGALQQRRRALTEKVRFNREGAL